MCIECLTDLARHDCRKEKSTIMIMTVEVVTTHLSLAKIAEVLHDFVDTYTHKPVFWTTLFLWALPGFPGTQGRSTDHPQ